MTGLEFQALLEVRGNKLKSERERWAEDKADFYNAHFVHQKQPVPFLPSDFLGGDRLKRVEEHREASARALMLERQLQLMKLDDTNVPDWAKKQWADARQ